MGLKVTIHQPEHFPYEGFFQKIKSADLYVVLDNVKYRKNYFQNRNRIKLLDGTERWLTVPVEKKAPQRLIRDVRVTSDNTWRSKILKTITENLNVDLTHVYDSNHLININMNSIKWLLGKMNIKTPIVYASELNVSGKKSELLANICKAVDATEYISGPSGRDYLEIKYFSGIEVSYFEPVVNNYYSMLYNLTR